MDESFEVIIEHQRTNNQQIQYLINRVESLAARVEALESTQNEKKI